MCGCGLPAATTARISSAQSCCGFGLSPGLQRQSRKAGGESRLLERYRESHPDTTGRNRTRQQTRDPARRVRDLANNHLALDLQSCAALFGCSAPPRCILPTTTWLPPKFIVEGLIQQPRNLANHNVLASAPVLTDNRISPPPCCATNRSTKFTTFTGAKMVATTDRPPFELEPAHRGQISHPAGAATSPAATNQQAGTVSCRHR